jgi:predicted dehydrogenase
MGKYKVMVIGMGKRGKHHASAFHANKNFQVAGICDIDEAKLKDEAAKLGNPAIGSDAAKMAKKSNRCLLFLHYACRRYDLIKIGIDCGAKLIAFEKPIADNRAKP